MHDMAAGDAIREEDLHMLSPGDGFKWDQLSEVVSRKLKNPVPANEVIYPKDLL